LVNIEIRSDPRTTSGADYRIVKVGRKCRNQKIQEIGWIEVHIPKKESESLARRMFVFIYKEVKVSDFTVMGAIERVFGPRYGKDSNTNFVIYFVRPVKLRQRVCVCEKCGRTEIRLPRTNMKCRECGGRMHKTDRKW